jgi:prepilin-type processing-associated H-X9-DG protein
MDGGGRHFSAFHPAGSMILMADGSVHLLSQAASPRLVAALITAKGGEPVSVADIP